MKKELIKPYGDRLNDGMVQLSFTLPIEYGAKAVKAAEEYVAKLSFKDINIAHASKIADNFTYFVVFAVAKPSLDFSSVSVREIKIEKMDFYEINKRIKKELKTKMNVVGASIGSDAHTVGIDAIMNMKGYNQNYGLERYPEINAYNLGAQVSPEDLILKALEVKAHAILVSQTVTQRRSHIANFKELIDLLEEKKLRNDFVLLAGGPRVNNDLAVKLGYNAGFGAGTLPSEVAAYILMKLLKKV